VVFLSQNVDEKGSKKSTPVFTSVFTPVSAVVFTSVFTWVFATRLGSTFRTLPLDAFLRPHGIQGTRDSGLYDFEVAPKSSGSGHPHSACGRKVGCEFLLLSDWPQRRVGVVTPTSHVGPTSSGSGQSHSELVPKSGGSGHSHFETAPKSGGSGHSHFACGPKIEWEWS
jgi:hypothetical protein